MYSEAATTIEEIERRINEWGLGSVRVSSELLAILLEHFHKAKGN